jgi:hypothetical protein
VCTNTPGLFFCGICFAGYAGTGATGCQLCKADARCGALLNGEFEELSGGAAGLVPGWVPILAHTAVVNTTMFDVLDNINNVHMAEVEPNGSIVQFGLGYYSAGQYSFSATGYGSVSASNITWQVALLADCAYVVAQQEFYTGQAATVNVSLGPESLFINSAISVRLSAFNSTHSVFFDHASATVMFDVCFTTTTTTTTTTTPIPTCNVPPVLLTEHNITVTRMFAESVINHGTSMQYTCPAGLSGDGQATGMNTTLVAYCEGSTPAVLSLAGDCINVDECNLGIHNCNQICVDVLGSFYCACRVGFLLQVSDRGTCVDYDECQLGVHSCVQKCQNTDGSFMCGCNVGYTLHPDGHSCIDNNECAMGMETCQQQCNDVPGSFLCSCFPGYRLSGDLQSCADVDECALHVDTCGHVCDNTVGSFTCSCNSGYALQADGHTCVDINECLDGNNGGCAQNCFNIPSTRTCSCNTTFMLGPDASSCADTVALSDNNGTALSGATLVDGDVYLQGATGISLPAQFVVSNTGFSLHVTFKTTVGASGYLLAKTAAVYPGNATRNVFYALRMRTDARISFVYLAQGSGVSASVDFALTFPVNDAQWHTLVLTVSGVVVSLRVDGGALSVATLARPVADCVPGSAAGCRLTVGDSGLGDTRALVGFIRNARVFFRRLVTVTSTDVPINASSVADAVIVARSLTLLPGASGLVHVFNGSRADENTAFGALAAVQAARPGYFSLTVTVQMPGNSSGYVLSKSNAQGTLRYFALYADQLGVRWYYKSTTANTLQLIAWGQRIDDGAFHRLAVVVNRTHVALYVDLGLVGGAAQLLNGTLDDCSMPSASCRLVMGARAGTGVSGVTLYWPGFMSGVTLYAGLALAFDPSPAAPPPFLLPTTAILRDDKVGALANVAPYFASAPYVDLLDRSRLGFIGNVGTANGLLALDGLTTGMRVLQHSFVLGSNFSLVFSVRIARDASGYLLAKSNIKNGNRYVALYYAAALRHIGSVLFLLCFLYAQ